MTSAADAPTGGFSGRFEAGGPFFPCFDGLRALVTMAKSTCSNCRIQVIENASRSTRGAGVAVLMVAFTAWRDTHRGVAHADAGLDRGGPTR